MFERAPAGGASGLSERLGPTPATLHQQKVWLNGDTVNSSVLPIADYEENFRITVTVEAHNAFASAPKVKKHGLALRAGLGVHH